MEANLSEWQKWQNLLDLVNRGAVSEVAEIIKANLADWDLRISKMKDGPVKNESIKDEFSALVDYSKTLERLLLEGCYYNVNKDVNSKNFSADPKTFDGGKAMLSFKLFHYPQFIYGDEHSMTDEQVFTEMDKVAYRPATPIEALSLALVHPLLQTYFPIVACGLVWRRSPDKRGVMFLGADNRKRKVAIHWYAFGGNNKVRFLGVRKDLL